MTYIISKRVVEALRLREAQAAFQEWATRPNPHSQSYIDSEGEERCSTCDKWLEPGYYGIDDHLRNERDRSYTSPWERTYP